MKKMKRVLWLIVAAAMAVSAGTITCSAERTWGRPDLEKAIYVNTTIPRIDMPNSEAKVYYSIKDIIDEDEKFGCLWTYNPNKIVVKMMDGNEPKLDEESDLKVKPFNKDMLSEYDKYGALFIDIDTEDTDDLYMIYGFDNTTTDAIEYCKNLLKENKADIANPIFQSDLCQMIPAVRSEDVQEYGFSNNLYKIDLVMKDNVTAKNFDMNCIANLSENLYKKVVKDNSILLQLNAEAEGVKMAEILTTLEKLEEVSKIFISGASLESGGISVTEINSVFENGDVNFDDEIDVFDAVNIAKYTVNTTQFNSEQKYLADYTGDNNIDVFDAIAVAKKTVE